MDEFESDHCPVCHKVVQVSNIEISETIRERFGNEIYVPGDDIVTISRNETDEKQRSDIVKFLEESRPPEIAPVGE